MNPNLPTVKFHEKHLKDIKFPLSFRICLQDLTRNTEKFMKIGYRNYNDFFRGQNRFNSSIIGKGSQANVFNWLTYCLS